MNTKCKTEKTGTLILDGHHGLMMISKKPMENKQVLLFDAFLVQHGMLYAEIDGF